jgi:hypothetical protein
MYVRFIKCTFLARGTGGGGKEQETLGKAPSSKVHSSTLKHFKFLRSDLLLLTTEPFPVLSDLKPPKRGAPGVPGVAGVEGTDGISSLSIF